MTPMLCQMCGQNPATIHYTEIKNEKRRELHICEECANKEGLGSGAPFPSFLANLAGIRQEPAEDLTCPSCGITFAEFRAKGRLGCPRDYEVFAEALTPILRKAHGAQRHTGRLPRGRRAVDTEASDRLLRLRHALNESVKTEKYEDAARLRDEIQGLEEAQRGEAGSDEVDDRGTV